MMDTTANDGGTLRGTAPKAKKPRLSNDEQLALLTLGDPLGSILKHCDVVSVCRIERTCKALRQSPLVQTHWERLDVSVPEKFRGTIGHGGKDRFSRFFPSSRVCEEDGATPREPPRYARCGRGFRRPVQGVLSVPRRSLHGNLLRAREVRTLSEMFQKSRRFVPSA